MKSEVLDEFEDIIDEMLANTGCGCCSIWREVIKQRKLLFKRLESLTVDDVCEVDNGPA
jgi:hypothetical protein